MENLTFEWEINEFINYCYSKQLRPKTILGYEQSLRLFTQWCYNQYHIETVDAVSENTIRHYISDLQERGKYTVCVENKAKRNPNYPEHRRDYRKPVNPMTINNYIKNIRVFFNWLDEDYVLKRNPMKKVRLLKVNRKTKEYLSDEDFNKLVRCLDRSYFSEHRDFAMIMLMIDSGMRLGECSTLLVSDLDLAHHQVALRAEMTKGRKDRVVFFSPKTETIIRRWIQYKDRYSDTDYLFPIKKSGKHIEVTAFETNFKYYLRRVGLNEDITPHCLRNNFAKRCLMNGMDIYTLSKLLGHSSVTVTEQAYLDLTDEDIAKRYQHYSPVELMQR